MDLDEATAKEYDLVVGAYVRSVEDFSPAQKAGLQAGDVIVKVDGQSITTMNELNDIKNSHKVGDVLTLTVNRNGEERELKITLEETP